jgi:tetratricopeptide (TPR) repeat protein
LPPAVCRLVHRLLAKRPQDRFASGGEVLKAIRALRSEGVSEDLIDGSEEWSTPELLALLDSRLSATQKLDRVLKTQMVLSQRRTRWWIAPLVIGVALAVGMMSAAAMKPRPLLVPTPESQPVVKRFDSAAAQWYYAQSIDTEEGWFAVAIYYTPDKNAINLQYVHKAKKGLADLYRRQGRLEESRDLYQQLTELDGTEDQLRTQGYAGLALLYDAAGRDDMVQTALAQLYDKLDRLDHDTAEEIRRLAVRFGGLQ